MRVLDIKESYWAQETALSLKNHIVFGQAQTSSPSGFYENHNISVINFSMGKIHVFSICITMI